MEKGQFIRNIKDMFFALFLYLYFLQMLNDKYKHLIHVPI